MKRRFETPQDKKVGIVIPLYNVAQYLRECIDSVLNQTYKNLSIVLVNDGSTDNNESLDIAKEYVAKDPRFILIDKENGGQSTARNVGIKWYSEKYETKLDSIESIDIKSTNEYETSNKGNDVKGTLHTYKVVGENPYNIHKIYSSGIDIENTESTSVDIAESSTLQPQKIDYIIFLDSDDLWKPYCIEESIKYSDGVEIVWFNLKFFVDGVKFKSNWSLMKVLNITKRCKISSNDWLYMCVNKGVGAFPFVVQGLIDFNYFKSINHCFLDRVYAEDHLFGTLLFLQSNFIYVLPEPFYIYRIRPGSSCNFDNKKIYIPKFFEETAKAFRNRKEARKYYVCSSWFILLSKFKEALDKNPQYLNKGLETVLLPHYARNCLGLFECKADPYNIIPKMDLIKPYLPDRYRYRLFIKNPKKFALLMPYFKLYDNIKKIEITTKRIAIKVIDVLKKMQLEKVYRLLKDIVLWYIVIRIFL